MRRMSLGGKLNHQPNRPDSYFVPILRENVIITQGFGSHHAYNSRCTALNPLDLVSGRAVYHGQWPTPPPPAALLAHAPPVLHAPESRPAGHTLLWKPSSGWRQIPRVPAHQGYRATQNTALLANGAGRSPLDTARLPTRRPRRTNAALGGHPVGKVRRARGSRRALLLYGRPLGRRFRRERVRVGAGVGRARRHDGARLKVESPVIYRS